MRRFTLFFILFFLFIVEGTVFQILAPDQYGVTYTFVPRWVFLVIIFIGIYRGRAIGTFYGVIFGLLYDVIFTSVLGVYTFGMGFIAYLLSISTPFFQKNLMVAILTSLISVVALEYYVYGMMFLLRFTNIVHMEFLYDRFIPSMIMNFVFIAIIAFPLRKLLNYLNRKQAEEAVQ